MCKEIRDKFLELVQLNVNDYVEQKDGLSYLSWAYAWQEFKKIYPDATYDILRDEQNRPYFGDPDIGYMVYTTVTAGGLTYMMWLPVMDGANKAMKLKPYQYTVKNKNFKYATLNKDDGKYYDKYGKEQTEYLTKTVEAISMFDVNKAVMRCLVKNLAMFGLGLYIYAGEDIPQDLKNYTCSVCGKEVKDVKKKDEIVPAKKVYESCGGMCYSCYRKSREQPKEQTTEQPKEEQE